MMLLREKKMNIQKRVESLFAVLILEIKFRRKLGKFMTKFLL